MAALSIHVSSNWEGFERELQKLLLLKTRDGTELANRGDIPLAGHMEPVLLEAPESTTGLAEEPHSPVLHVESFSPMEDLVLDSVEVISEARNVEVYGEGEEYIGTATGVVSAEGNEDLKMYSCRYRFHGALPLVRLTLKFVSLGGRHKFYIQRIRLTFRQLPSGLSSKNSRQQLSASSGPPQWSAAATLPVEMSALHVSGVPQEVAGLVNVLQHLGTMNRGGTGRDIGRGRAGEVPPEVQSAMSMLRQLRGSAAAEEDGMHTANSEPQVSQSEQTETAERPSDVQSCPGCGQLCHCVTKDDLQQMEARVMEHVDRAVNRLQNHFDSQIDKLAHVLESLAHNP